MQKIPFHLKLIRGAIGRRFVIKHYGKKIVMTRFPDMTHIQPSKKQQLSRQLFAQAVVYAKGINSDPELKSSYQLKLPKGKSVYRAAIQEYLRIHNPGCKAATITHLISIKPLRKVRTVYPISACSLCVTVFISERDHFEYKDTG